MEVFKMKTRFLFSLIFIMLITIFTGCPVDPGNKPTATSIPLITPTPIPVIPAENPVKFALYDGTNLMYYDGENTKIAYSGKIKKAANRVLSVDNVLTYFDDYGSVEYSKWLPLAPDAIIIDEIVRSKDIVYEDDVWILEHITPEEAYAAGAMYRDYCRIYYNGVEITDPMWWMNQWEPHEILLTESGLIIARNNLGSYHNINGTEAILKAYNNGMIIYNVNTSTHSGYFADNEGIKFEQWGYNYFNGCRWQEANNKWYASHGYTWSYNEGLIENANVMWSWTNQSMYPTFVYLANAQSASILPAGIQFENGEEVTYWIECNLGVLFRFIPSINQMEYIARIYVGDGSKITGALQINNLKPIWNDGLLYFHNDGSIKVFDPVTGVTSIFSEDMEIIEW